ncbi:hypothetical protein TYRP_022268 [Tyrophagus putrescentiae]|nr:hypothetical protein TYRP_022265 [Tyrophagus putrescentiae]KAH9391999.1 hypothetical protein TYRP_022268 [Tyrophagus putrescentiae]
MCQGIILDGLPSDEGELESSVAPDKTLTHQPVTASDRSDTAPRQPSSPEPLFILTVPRLVIQEKTGGYQSESGKNWGGNCGQYKNHNLTMAESEVPKMTVRQRMTFKKIGRQTLN